MKCSLPALFQSWEENTFRKVLDEGRRGGGCRHYLVPVTGEETGEWSSLRRGILWPPSNSLTFLPVDLGQPEGERVLGPDSGVLQGDWTLVTRERCVLCNGLWGQPLPEQKTDPEALSSKVKLLSGIHSLTTCSGSLAVIPFSVMNRVRKEKKSRFP